jgi:sulfhydrogenase subunit beta (sulfur reductase)
MFNKENFRVLYKHDFEKFLMSLLEKFTVYGFSKKDDNIFTKIDKADNINFDYRNSKRSLKEFFFPQSETLFTFEVDKNETPKTSGNINEEEKQNVLFGIRPCDAMSISLLDTVFNGNDPQDYYYTKKRNTSCIISLACNKPSATCFCTSVGCGPDAENGADIIFFELSGRFLVKTITPRGKEMIDSLQELLKPAADNDVEEKTNLMKTARNKLGKIFEGIDVEKKLENFNAPYWEKIHQKCLGCGVCTFLCPTCHCFDITDEVIKSCGRRVRTWDSCMFPLFTLHASGHNPRPTHKERMRQRIMHKFNYALKCYNEIFCVGCGRCIIHCPVNMDIRRIIMEIMEAQ